MIKIKVDYSDGDIDIIIVPSKPTKFGYIRKRDDSVSVSFDGDYHDIACDENGTIEVLTPTRKHIIRIHKEDAPVIAKELTELLNELLEIE